MFKFSCKYYYDDEDHDFYRYTDKKLPSGGIFQNSGESVRGFLHLHHVFIDIFI